MVLAVDLCEEFGAGIFVLCVVGGQPVSGWRTSGEDSRVGNR